MRWRVFFMLILALALIGGFGWTQRSYRGEEFAGANFDGQTPENAAQISTGLESYLLANGFARMDRSPEWAGVHSAGEREMTFAGQTDATRDVEIRVSSLLTSVHTSVRWGVKGFNWQTRNARVRAFRAATGIDTWVKDRPEENLVPAWEMARTWEWLQSKIARNGED